MKTAKHSDRKTVGIIGHFGGKKVFLDGQTIKTKILYEELRNATDWELFKVETYYKKERPLGLLLRTLRCLFRTRDVIILLSGNGMKLYFPLLFFFSKHFHTRVYHDVIGGNLDSYVRDNPKFKAYLNSFQANWVETEGLKNRLTALGVTNCSVIPNFKRLDLLSEDELVYPTGKPYRLCTFSRVCKEKGIEDAVHAVASVNETLGYTAYTLDIYGQVDSGQTEWFEQLMKAAPCEVQYKGSVAYDQSVAVIKNYFALLFPTQYFTEGIPGTIIDAYAAGVPVISSKWAGFSDVIHEGITGVGYSFGALNELVEVLIRLVDNPETMIEMKKSCLEESKKYELETVVRDLLNHLKV